MLPGCNAHRHRVCNNLVGQESPKTALLQSAVLPPRLHYWCKFLPPFSLMSRCPESKIRCGFFTREVALLSCHVTLGVWRFRWVGWWYNQRG